MDKAILISSNVINEGTARSEKLSIIVRNDSSSMASFEMTNGRLGSDNVIHGIPNWPVQSQDANSNHCVHLSKERSTTNVMACSKGK